ncbi:MBL fold metallo-hydrolase [Paenarthrobacter nicotinovorans]|uniref:MBL fold metallo-hydrolase n=1 Tax=Paenarthrobacter nicotinovorans TaxID=29320 RepID=UPI003A80C26E
MSLEITLVGGPTAVLDFDGFRILIDPTFDEPRSYGQEGSPVTMVKTAGPAFTPEELAPVHLVLASHEHEDNLDHSGRAYLAAAGRGLTTPEAAAKFGDNVGSLEPYESVVVPTPDGRSLTITGVPALHGPEGVWQIAGPVTGWVLSGEDIPTTYVSGDNSWLELIEEISNKCGPIDVAVLFVGGARFEELGGAYMTLSNEDALAAAGTLGEAVIVPVHADSWAHFSQTTEGLKQMFDERGFSDRIVALKPGQSAKIK